MFRKVIACLAINAKEPDSWNYMKTGYKLFHSSYGKMKKYQDLRYQKLLLYAYEHTVYYHRIFDEIGLIRNGQVVRDRYAEIPILTKDIIRKEGKNLVSDEAGKRGAYRNTSGGSTGEPVLFLQDREYFACNFGNKLLFGILNGKKPGEKEIKLWGNEKDILEGSIGRKEKCINWCFNRIFLNSFVLTPELMKKYVAVINKERPKQIWAYAESIYQLAKYINENRLHVYAPYNIVSTAGVLYDEMRNEISRAFTGSHILNQYGSRETGAIGCEIGHKRGIRIFDHSVKLEILKKDQSICDCGEGELLVTNLINYSMPLIRYRIGDTGKVTHGLDGWKGSFSVLERLTGRTNTHLKKEDGGLVHGEYVTHLFYHKEWVENFRVIQHSYQLIEFQIVLKKGFQADDQDIHSMKQDLQKVMGNCQIKVTYLDQIPRLKSGKYQFVISEVEERILQKGKGS